MGVCTRIVSNFVDENLDEVKKVEEELTLFKKQCRRDGVHAKAARARPQRLSGPLGKEFYELRPAMGSKAHKPKLRATQDPNATIQSDQGSATDVSDVWGAGGGGGAAFGGSEGESGPRGCGCRFGYSSSFVSLEL